MSQADGTVLRTGIGSGMKFQDFVPTIWTGRLLANMKGRTVLAEQCTREYEGEIKGFGDTVYVPGVDRITVADYTVGTNITWNRSDSNKLTILVDRARYWTTTTDDVEKAQSKPEYIDELMKEAAFALAKNTEQYLYGRMVAGAALTSGAADDFGQIGGTGATPHTIDTGAAASVYDTLVTLGVKMDDNETPTEGRFVVLPSFAHGLLLKDSRFVGAGAYKAPDAIGKGEVGQIAGFTVYSMPRGYFDAPSTTTFGTGYIDQDSYTSTALSSTDQYKGIAGCKGAVAYVEQLVKTEKVRLEDQFADGIRGLHVYGSGILRPQWLFALDIDDPDVGS